MLRRQATAALTPQCLCKTLPLSGTAAPTALTLREPRSSGLRRGSDGQALQVSEDSQISADPCVLEGIPNVKEQKTLLEDELVRSILALPKDSTFASSLYHQVATHEQIEDFLKETKAYDSDGERWKLPRSSKNLEEKTMYKPLVKLLNAILEWFWKDTATGLGKALSKAIDTNATPLWHQEIVETGHFSRPDVSVKAEGPSFQLPHRKTKGNVGFSNMATCFEVKIENQRKGLMRELLQLAVYAR